MKSQEGGMKLVSFLPKISYERQTTLLKLLILSIAAVLCESYYFIRSFCYYVNLDKCLYLKNLSYMFVLLMFLFYFKGS